MTVPAGFRFRPSDEELVEDYLRSKFNGESLPYGVVSEREIYGAGDKAPWQILTDQDPWEICKTQDKKKDKWKTEGTIYVFTTLKKASEKKIARIAGCGCWHGETARIDVKNDKGDVIGFKRMLCFEITDESVGVMDRKMTKGHWIMHEYSLRDGNTMNGKGKYVLCRIKFDNSKDTKKSPRKRKHVEGATIDDDLVVPRPAKRVRTEFVQEQKTECDHNVAALEAKVVQDEELEDLDEVHAYLSEEIATTDDDVIVSMSDDLNELTVEELEAIWEHEELVPLDNNTVVEQQQSFGLDFDATGNISLTPEVVPLGLVKSFEDDWHRYSENLSNAQTWVESESDWFLSPNTMFLTTIEPLPIFTFSNEYFLDQQKKNISELDDETLWWLGNLS